MPAPFRFFLRLAPVLVWLACARLVAAADSAGSEPAVQLPDYRVQGNPVEDFGFRVSPVFDSVRQVFLGRTFSPVVDLVLPNTAASKAGIRPGDRIVRADGQATGSGESLSVWRDLQSRKWQELREAPAGVEWRLDVENIGNGEVRAVVLRLPTPAPRWGAAVWQPPEGRKPAPMTEAGPLAERAQQVLDNGIWMILRGFYATGFGFSADAKHPLILGYQWTLWDERGGHRLFVTQHRGRTEIVLEFITQPNHRLRGGDAPTESPDPTLSSERTTLGATAWAYLTSPEGNLQAALQLARKKPLLPAEARPGFDAEMNFWRERAGKVSPRWPLELVKK